MGDEELAIELLATLAAINQTLSEMILRHNEERHNGWSIIDDEYPSFFAMMDTTGKPICADLLVAKAHILIALHGIKAKEN